MAFVQGHVVIARDPFKRGRESQSRPFMVLSNRTHPFHGHEYVTVALTTRPREDVIPLTPSSWVQGSTDDTSYVAPWTLTTVKADDIYELAGRVTDDVTDDVRRQAMTYLLDNTDIPPIDEAGAVFERRQTNDVEVEDIEHARI